MDTRDSESWQEVFQGLLSSQERVIPRKGKNGFDVMQLLEQIQQIPKALLVTPQGVALVSLLAGVTLETAGYSKMTFRLKQDLFLDEATQEKVEIAPSENAYCLALPSSDRSIQCELKPKLNIEFDIWPWKGLLIPAEFGKFDLPVAKLLIILGTMGLSAEFIKGIGGIVPG